MVLAFLTLLVLAPGHGGWHARIVAEAAHRAEKSESVLPGSLLIADKYNNRLILVGWRQIVKWTYPRPGEMPRGQSFLIPDDAFFTPGGQTILATEEDYHVIREIDFRTHRIVWQYGHPGYGGSTPGYLNNPDGIDFLPKHG